MAAACRLSRIRQALLSGSIPIRRHCVPVRWVETIGHPEGIILTVEQSPDTQYPSTLETQIVLTQRLVPNLSTRTLVSSKSPWCAPGAG